VGGPADLPWVPYFFKCEEAGEQMRAGEGSTLAGGGGALVPPHQTHRHTDTQRLL